MSRRQAILESVLIFAVFCVQGAWPVPEVNEPYYLGKAIHYWNPHWACGDWFLQTSDTHSVFYFSVGWLALWLRPTALAWTVRLITWAALAWSWQRLSRAVVPRAWLSVIAATLFLFLLQHFNMAGEWVVGGAEAKGFSFALLFLALEAMIDGYWNRMWLLLGVASAFHILVGGWAAVAAGLVWMGRDGEGGRGKAERGRCISSLIANPQSLIPPAIAFALALPGLLPSLQLDRGADSQVIAKARQIYVFERFPHHLDPTKFWADGFVLPFLMLVLFWLLLWRTASNSPGTRRLQRFTAAAIAIALIGAAISLLSLRDKVLAAGWMRFYWYRLADVAVPLGLSLTLMRWLVYRKMRVAMVLVVAIALFHLADCAVLRLFADPPFAERQVDGVAWRSTFLWASGHPQRPLFPRRPRADKLKNYSDWLEVCRWVDESGNIPSSARFLIPRAASTFKWYAERGEVVNWKETPQDAASLVGWWQRINDIYATNNPPPQDRFYQSMADAGSERLKQLATKYEADYLVTQVSTPLLPLPVLHQNDNYIVYKMR